MDLKSAVAKLVDEPCSSDYIENTGKHLAGLIEANQLKIVEILQELDQIITNRSHDTRLRGVKLLTRVVTCLPKGLLLEKEIDLLSEFLCLRLVDHKSMEMPALRSLSYFLDCKKKPDNYNKKLVEVLKTKINVQKMDDKVRYEAYAIMKKIVLERQRCGKTTIDSDLLYSLVHIIEGENRPDNLMLCFSIVDFILKNFSELEPYIDDLFEWLSSYYPIDYTPTDDANSEAIRLQRSDLVQALYDCFYATPLNASNLQALLIDKLDSNVMSTKLESLRCLNRCYEEFPLSTLKDYARSLWTAIRMTCLKKEDLVNQKLFNECLTTLSNFSRRLAEDNELYFTFISEIFEELAIAFRKPEMDLFTPAAKLVTHAISPSIVGFNYVLDKILPVCLNALSSNEFRPVSGLTYMFKQLHLNHPAIRLKEDLDSSIDKLVSKLVELDVELLKNGLDLLNAIVDHRVQLESQTIDSIIRKLSSKCTESSGQNIERCLAVVCYNYKRSEIICDSPPDDYRLDSLVKLIASFRFDDMNIDDAKCSRKLLQFSIYVRLLLIILDKVHANEIDSIEQTDLEELLKSMRHTIESAPCFTNKQLIEKIARLHAIVINKLSDNNINQIMMNFFQSNYCQRLIPLDSEEGKVVSKNVYLPLLGWVHKSLVIRNHQFAVPLTNLLLNFIVSNSVQDDLANAGVRIFDFIQSSKDTDENLFETSNHYRKFILYKQKFYSQSSKEVRIRYETKTSSDNRAIKNRLVCSIALQIPHLPVAAFKKDLDWLLRELLKCLFSLESSSAKEGSSKGSAEQNKPISEGGGKIDELDKFEDLLEGIYGCIESLIERDQLSANISSFLTSLIEVSLRHATKSKVVRTRRRALECLTKIAASFNPSDLLIFRAQVVDKLRECLDDKKRLVRQAAGEARMRWFLIGQPIGSSTGLAG